MKFLVTFLLLTSQLLAADPVFIKVWPLSEPEVVQSRRPRLLFFTASWCTPCQTAKWSEVIPGSTSNQRGGFLHWLKDWEINETDRAHIQLVDYDANPTLVNYYGINSIPSIVLIDDTNHYHKAVPYSNMSAMAKLLEPYTNANSSKFSSLDLARVGVKLRPDLGSGVNTPYGVITCWHCISSGKPIELECDGESVNGVLVARDIEKDIALIHAPWTKQHPTVDLSTSMTNPMTLVARGDDGLIALFPNIEVTGKDFDSKLIMSRPSVSKQSGGGYIDANGDLAGIVSGNIAIEPFKGLMIPAESIKTIIPIGYKSTVNNLVTNNAAYANTPYAEVTRVLTLLPKPQVGFIEYGCGADARWCVAAVERWNCKAVGIEIDPDKATSAKERRQALGLSDKITIIEGDATQVKLTGDVGAAFLYSDTLQKLKPSISQLSAFASYMHQPGLPATQSGDSWIYTKQYSTATYANKTATWGGQQYSAPVCNNPRCAMCNSIRSQLSH